eukprot:scaffold4488_cov101-Skeletonema_dohrnii-CCMP3373.AAC.3
MYKSKSDKDDDDSGSDASKSRSWFKPWRWFARRERRKRQPKISPTIESLLYAFKEAKDLGIIKVNDNDNGGDGRNTVNVNGTFPTQIAPETIQQIIDAVPSDRPLIIENTFVGNTYKHTNQNGLEILPTAKFRNDMAGAFHNNNNAAAKYGNVTRQNGVADFTYALRNNNNAVSKTGDVSRRNGVFAPVSDDEYHEEGEEEDGEEDDNCTESLLNGIVSSSKEERKSKIQQQGSNPASASAPLSSPLSRSKDHDDDGDFFSLFGKQPDSSRRIKDKPSTVDDHEISDVVTAYMRGSFNNNNSTTSWYEVFNSNSTNPPVVVRNTYIGNKYETTTHNGLNLGVGIDFKNDMRETFYENNNAVTYEGNIRRQNGVADFTNALRKNNNAVSGSGDVDRENGVDDAALPLLLPLLDFNFTLPDGSNSTLFDAVFGGIFRFYKHKIKKKKAQKDKLKSAVVDYYKPKVNRKKKLARLPKASKIL